MASDLVPGYRFQREEMASQEKEINPNVEEVG